MGEAATTVLGSSQLIGIVRFHDGGDVSGAVGGMVAGIGIGWLANLLRRARRSTRVAPCA